MSRRLAAILAALFALTGLNAAALAQSVVELRPSARIAPGAPLTLGQIAVLTGDDALTLTDVPLAPKDGDAGSTISIDDVRAAIKAHGRINWGRLTLRGATCLVSRDAPDAAPAPAAPGAAPTPILPPAPIEGTVRAAAITRLAQVLGVTPEDIKATFQPADEDVLRLPTSGRSVEIHAAGASDKLPLAITLFEGNRIIASRTIRADVQVRRTVLIAVAPKHRGDTLTADDVRDEPRWMGPTATPASRDDAIGTTVQSHLHTGDPIMQADVAPIVIVAKGEVVSIRCISGSVVLATRGRATAAGRTGDVVQFQSLDGKRAFFARIDGKGRAVVAAGDAVPAETGIASRTVVMPAPAGSRAVSRALESMR